MSLSLTALDSKIENFLSRKFKQHPDISEDGESGVFLDSSETSKPHRHGF